MTSASRWSATVSRAARERCEPTLIISSPLSPQGTARCARALCLPDPPSQRCAPNYSPHAALLQHADLIKTIASRLHHPHLPLSQQELEQCGHIALIELAQRHHARLLTASLIWQRVRGAMIDACRREGWRGRRCAHSARPQVQIELLEPHSFDEQLAPPRQDPRAHTDLQNTLRAALAELPAADQALLLQHDLNDIPLRELARSMRRAPSRLSHRRTAALDALRDRLHARGIRSSADLL